MQIFQPLQIADANGAGTGRWRLTYRSDEGTPRHPIPLCKCEGGHLTEVAARECPYAQAGLPPEMRTREPDPQDAAW